MHQRIVILHEWIQQYSESLTALSFLLQKKREQHQRYTFLTSGGFSLELPSSSLCTFTIFSVLRAGEDW